MVKHLVLWKLKPEAHGQAHPEHKAVLPFILEARSERRLVDYEG